LGSVDARDCGRQPIAGGASHGLEKKMSKTRIVLVDNNLIFLRMAALYVAEIATAEVVGCAASGTEAVGMVDTLKPDMIVIDLVMPGIDGIEAARQIRTRGSNAFIVIATLSDIAAHRARADEAGVDAFISKARFADEVGPMIANAAERSSGQAGSMRYDCACPA
jgi:CheY-like chemotaxis protein